MYRINAEGQVLVRGENKELERVLLEAGVRSAVLWDLKTVMDAYANQGVTVSEREAELWFSVCGDKLQEVAAAAGEKLARQLIENEIQLRREAGENF
jgi:hypothetical protein